MPIKKASLKTHTINFVDGNEILMYIAFVDSFNESEFILEPHELHTQLEGLCIFVLTCGQDPCQ